MFNSININVFATSVAWQDLTWLQRHGIFHCFWTSAVGTKNYNKEFWKKLEVLLFKEAPMGYLD